MQPLRAALLGYLPEAQTVLHGHDQSFKPLPQLFNLVATQLTLKDAPLHPKTVALQQFGKFAAVEIAGVVIGNHHFLLQ